MNPILLDSLDKLVAHYREDARCLGLYLLGSIGRGETDAYSDVDVALVARDADYEAVKGELRAVCEELCGPIAVWLPEGESPGFCNYAFLYEAGEHLLLYDFEIVQQTVFTQRRMRPDRILFDPTGLLQSSQTNNPPKPYSVANLGGLVDTYWVYMYLNGKYFRRDDLYKLLYVQNVLFHNHLKILNALHPETTWTWWANDVKHLTEEKRQQLLVYFGASSLSDISAAIVQELDLFSQDAMAACAKDGLEYPAALESGVRKYLAAMGVLPA